MSTPNEHNNTHLNPQPIPPEESPRKGTSPLIWLLLLLALAVLGWWFYNKSVQNQVQAPAPDAPVAITSEQEAAAQAERERAEANEARRAQRERAAAQAASKPAKPADRELEPIARAEPEYPPAALRAREEGTVLVRVSVDAAGNPTDVEVAKRSGSRDLDRAALDAVRKWRFKPAIKDGKEVASTAEVPVEFSLTDQ